MKIKVIVGPASVKNYFSIIMTFIIKALTKELKFSGVKRKQNICRREYDLS